MALSNGQLRERRRAANAHSAFRRRRIALTCVAVIAFPAGLIAGAREGESPDQPPVSAAAGLTDEQLVGQRLVAGFDGTRVPDGLRRMVELGRLAGVILFEDNIADRSTTRRLTADLQTIPRPEGLDMPLVVSVDQEGGLVKRLDGPPELSAAEMGAAGPEVAYEQGAATAADLASHGINVDLAPVLDVGRPGGALEEEDRVFGRSASTVAATGVDGFAAGLRSGGVAATAKHFPGLGAAEVNTDEASQDIGLSVESLRSLDEAPFRHFADEGGELVMLGLATYPALDGSPAAFSHRIATEELREEVGFEGVSITDSLDATAATTFGSRKRVALAAAGAGADLLLYGDWRTASEVSAALRRGLQSGGLDRAAFVDSVERVLALRSELPE